MIREFDKVDIGSKACINFTQLTATMESLNTT